MYHLEFDTGRVVQLFSRSNKSFQPQEGYEKSFKEIEELLIYGQSNSQYEKPYPKVL